MLSNAAFNALLKTLEEPPKHVIFILATTEPYKLPSTILSRCQRFDFESLSRDDILKRLHIVAEEEKIKITEEALNQIACSAEGGMRDALSLLDQTISFSVNEEISLGDVLSVSGNVGYRELLSILSNCLAANGTEALKRIDLVLKDGKEVPRIINDLIIFLRDVLLFKNNAILDDKLEFHNEEFIAFAKKITKTVIYSWLDYLNETNNTMRFSNQKRAYLELAILKMSDLKLNEEANILERIEQLEQTIDMLSKAKPISPTRPQIQMNIPTAEEIKKIQEKPIIPTLIKEEAIANDDEVKIEEIEQILNTASKSRKVRLQAIWKQIGIDYSEIFIAQILVAGEIAAVNENKLIVVLNDLGFSNRLMRYENYQKIIEILDNYNANITDYICLPKEIWAKIRNDYLSKYSVDSPIVHLEPLRIGVKKRQEPGLNDRDEQLLKLEELIDKEKIEIMEE